jgi:AraC-like DNA-binding protein/GGDEF domain-containing protein
MALEEATGPKLTPLFLRPSSLGSASSFGDVAAVDGAPADDVFCIAGIVDVDDFVVSRISRGEEWAAAVIAQIEQLIRREQQHTAPSSRAYHLEPDEWVFLLHGPAESPPLELGMALAERLCTAIASETEVTATVSLGRLERGARGTERSLSDAVRANQRKLVLGGNRVILAEAAEGDAQQGQPAPERIEQELSRRIREGDREGTLELLKDWIARSANLEGVTPEVLRSWIAAVVLFCRDVVGQRRLSDGSMDWVEIFGKGETTFDALMSIATIHEQSYLGLWLEEILPPIIDNEHEAKPSKCHILALVEAYLHEHYAEDIGLARVSAALFVSPFYVSHLFNRELGTTFLKYLNAIRMAKARQLLLETDETINSIAEQVGYTTPKNFRSVFKRTIGVTPTEFRSSRRPAV